ncbi:hypothetical protein D9611_001699 [Ephemerocybe angulata]|uniref:Uncharacterized protein n=1 Tax=Ephemerocybe angulata TaxID=980116 RepID=A0A8H5FMP2_9AGAR|nr:hypothetical protein D9611_001699 [Tulosesus angulatus]
MLVGRRRMGSWIHANPTSTLGPVDSLHLRMRTLLLALSTSSGGSSTLHPLPGLQTLLEATPDWHGDYNPDELFDVLPDIYLARKGTQLFSLDFEPEHHEVIHRDRLTENTFYKDRYALANTILAILVVGNAELSLAATNAVDLYLDQAKSTWRDDSPPRPCLTLTTTARAHHRPLPRTEHPLLTSSPTTARVQRRDEPNTIPIAHRSPSTARTSYPSLLARVQPGEQPRQRHPQHSSLTTGPSQFPTNNSRAPTPFSPIQQRRKYFL